MQKAAGTPAAFCFSFALFGHCIEQNQLGSVLLAVKGISVRFTQRRQ